MSLSSSNQTRRHYCVINCENSKAWSPIDFADMFIKGLKENDSCDQWDSINVANGESVPDSIQCRQYQGIILTGSRFNVRDGPTLLWFEPLCELIRNAASSGSPRIYGGCFGCQILAHALGGEVGFNPNNRFILKAEVIRMAEGFESILLASSNALPPLSPSDEKKGEDLTLVKALRELQVADRNGSNKANHVSISASTDTINAATNSITADKMSVKSDIITTSKSRDLKIIVSHGDCVLTLPPDSLHLGSSFSCANEMYLTGPHKSIFACQSHPEFDYEYAIKERIWLAVVDKNKRLNDDEIVVAIESFAGFTRKDPDVLLGLIRSFLRS